MDTPSVPVSSLQRTTKMVAMIQMIVSGALAVVWIAGLVAVQLLEKETPTANEEDRQRYIAVISISATMAAAYIFELFLAVVLYVGANQRSLGKCRLWLFISIVSVGIWAAGVITNLIYGTAADDTTGPTTSSTVFSVIALICRVYIIWVVCSFVSELKREA